MRSLAKSSSGARLKPVLFLIAGVSASVTSVAGDIPKKYKVHRIPDAGAANMREDPMVSAKVIAWIPYDTVVAASGPCNENWCPVNYKTFTGWVFQPLLDETDESVTQVAVPPPSQGSPEGASLTGKVCYRASPSNPVAVLSVVEHPGPGMPLTGFIPPTASGIEELDRCTPDWCHVRYQQVEGWVLKSQLKREQTPFALPAGTESHAAGGAKISASFAFNEMTPIEGDDRRSPLASAEDKGGVKFRVMGLSASAWLAMREAPAGSSRLLGAVPPDAVGIDDMSKCVGEWCLIRYRGATGFAQRRFLARPEAERGLKYSVDGIAMDEALNVFDAPGDGEKIVGFIPSYASGIVAMDRCERRWCHIRYLGLAGWVPAQNLASDSGTPGG